MDMRHRSSELKIIAPLHLPWQIFFQMSSYDLPISAFSFFGYFNERIKEMI